MLTAAGTDTSITNQRKRASFCCFLLGIMVVCIHSETYSLYPAVGNIGIFIDRVQRFICRDLTFVAVPLFFAYSGYRFFTGYTPAVLNKKYRSRFFSTVIPYYVWNLIYTLLHIISSETFISQMIPGIHKMDITPKSIIHSIVFHAESNSYFWFIFNIIVFNILSPLLYYLLKRRSCALAFFASLIAFVCVFDNKLPVLEMLFFRLDSVVYYTLGAIAALCFKECINRKITVPGKYLPLLLIAVPAISLLYHRLSSVVILRIALTLCYMLILVFIINSLLDRIPMKSFYSSSFLLYASHGIIHPIFTKLYTVILPRSQFAEPFILLFSVASTVTAVCAAYVVIKKKSRFLDLILCGGR